MYYCSVVWFTIVDHVVTCIEHAGMESNFEVTSTSFVTTQGIPYDIMSVMHYSAYAFSRNGRPTIEPVDRSIPLSALGQRRGFSPSDLEHVNTLYCRRGCKYFLQG